MKTKILQRVLWLMIPLLTLFAPSISGATWTIGYNNSMFIPALPTASGSEYSTATAHHAYGMPIKEAGIYKNASNSYLMFVSGKNYLYNTQSLGTITKVEVTYSSTCSTQAKAGVYFGSSELSTRQTSSQATIKGQSQTDTWTNSTPGLGFFQLVTTNKNCQITSIVVTYDAGDFVLVESTPDSWDGEYLIVYNNTNAMNTHSGNVDANTFSTYTSISSYYTSSTKTIEANATTEGLVYIVGATTGGHFIKRKAADELLGYNNATSGGSNGSYLRWDQTFSANRNVWTVGVGSIVSVYNNSKAIRYNTSSPRFAIYGTTGQSAVQLFKRTLPPSCAEPTALTKGTISLSDTTNQTRGINWTSAAGKVDICYSTSNTTPGASPSSSYTVISNITSSPYNLNITNLAAGSYHVWARSVCDASTKSDWVKITGDTIKVPGFTLTINASPSGSGTFTPTSGQTVKVYRERTITASPATGYTFTSWAVSGTGASLSSTSTNPTTFTMGTANATVTGTFTANEVTGWTWKQQSEGSTEITIPAVVDLYVGQQAWFNLKSYTPDVIDAKKGYNASYSTTYLAQDNKAGTYYRTRAKEPTESTTLTFTSTSNSSVTQVITIRITALPYATFTDIIHGETFGDVTAEVDATDKRIVTTTKKTPTHSDLSDPGSGNECERNHLHLAGWILKDWADEHPDATSSDISGAGAGNFYAPDADIDLVAKNGKTFYAVWAIIE